jgi:hypothetical protein
MDSTRLTQFGTWSGTIDGAGARLALDGAHVLGCRDRSWGIRPVGEPRAARPAAPAVLLAVGADPLRRPLHPLRRQRGQHGTALARERHGRADRHDDVARIETMTSVAHRIAWASGTRRARAAEIALTAFDGTTRTIALEPLLTFQMRGLGYLDPEWGHGQWKGAEAVDGQTWTLGDLDPMDPRHLHVQQLCRARMGDRSGIGVLEQLVIGRTRRRDSSRSSTRRHSGRASGGRGQEEECPAARYCAAHGPRALHPHRRHHDPHADSTAMVFAVIVSISRVATAEPHPCAVRADVVAVSDTLAEVAGRRLRLDACRDRCVAEVRACEGATRVTISPRAASPNSSSFRHGSRA